MALKNKKSLGQNWLKDRATLDLIADLATDLPETKLDTPVETCLEIGPGLGTLTSSLLKRFKKVVAVEFDTNLAHNLPASFPGKNLTVINEDILQFNFSSLEIPYVVAGNIPYYITSPIIETLLTLETKPEKIVLLVQKEVAEKLCPVEAKLKNSSFSLFVENLATPHLGPVVPRELFTPPPKVDSRVLILEPRPVPLYQENPGLMNFIKNCFKNPRKKLSANLIGSAELEKSAVESLLASLGKAPDSRPSDLNLDDYAKLAKLLQKS